VLIRGIGLVRQSNVCSGTKLLEEFFPDSRAAVRLKLH
jgi:hypothetical protein